MQTGHVASSIARALAVPQSGMRDPIIGKLVVDNPVEYAERVIHPMIPAERNLRDDALGQMHDRRQISEAQYAAGRRWQLDWEAAGARIKSSGDLQEPVDGGGFLAKGITDRQMKAHDRLKAYAAALGPDGHGIVTLVLADKLSLREVANRRHIIVSKATMTYVGHRFRECLDALAKCMGLAS